jgi:hypothetical protein
MPLPLTLDTPLTAASPVPSNRINLLEEAVVGAKHGLIEIPLAATGWRSAVGSLGGMQFGAGAIGFQAVTPFAMIEIPVIVGRRLHEVRFGMFGNGAADITAIDVYKITAANVETSIGTLAAINNEPAAWATKTVNVDPDYTFLTGESCILKLDISAGGIVLGRASAFYDKP